MDSCELVTFISTAACALSKCLNEDELSMAAVIFSQLGDTLATIIAHNEICNKSNEQIP